jgi:hypothetical protein
VPRVAIPITTVTLAGVELPTPTAGDATNDHYFANVADRTILIAKNTDSVSRSFTIITSYTVALPDGSGSLPVDDKTYTVLNGKYFAVGVFAAAIFGQSTDSLRVYVDIAQTTWEFWALAH